MTPKLKLYHDILNDENTSGSLLFLLIFNKLATTEAEQQEIIHWDPETFQKEIKDVFQMDMPLSNFNKMMAARELVASNSFWYDLPDFILLANALSNGVFEPRVFDAANMEEIAWAVLEAALMWPPDKTSREEFADEIVAYISEVAAAEGLSKIPAVLKFAIPEDSPIWDQLTAQFSDDPVMFDAIYKLSIAKTATIDNMILERLDYMLEQVEKLGDELPDETGKLIKNVRDLVEKYAVKLE